MQLQVWHSEEEKHKTEISTDFFGDTDSSSMVDSSSPSKPNRSLLCFCKITTARKTFEWTDDSKIMEYLHDGQFRIVHPKKVILF